MMQVEDKYYPGEPTILGSCENYEDRASRLDVFGAAKVYTVYPILTVVVREGEEGAARGEGHTKISSFAVCCCLPTQRWMVG